METLFCDVSDIQLISLITAVLAIVVTLFFLISSKKQNTKLCTKDSSIKDEGEDFENYIDGVVLRVKKARSVKYDIQLTEDQMQKEIEVEREQLKAIYELLKQQEAANNVKEIDEEELTAQMNLYR